MSFELAMWSTAAGMTLDEAVVHYDRLLDDEPSASPADGVAALVEDLTARYPDGPELSTFTDAVVLSLGQTGRTAMIGFVRELADRHGLVVFDPQNREVHHPEVMRRTPRMAMWTADGSQRDDPDADTIGAMLWSLSERNHYAVLARGTSYVQTMWCAATRSRPEHYALEHREDGDPDRHFRVEVRDRADVLLAFTGFADDDPGWKLCFDWQELSPLRGGQ